MRTATPSSIPRITIVSALQEDQRAQIVFRCEDGTTYDANLWFNPVWPHPNTAWTIEIYRKGPHPYAQFCCMYEQGCPRDNGAYYLAKELVRLLSVRVSPTFD